jgi:uncharacterized membrane protein
MKPLIILLATFLITIIILWLSGKHDYQLAARISMSVMLLFTAVGHFAFPKGMIKMIPAPVPFKKTLVIISGLFEIVAAIGLVLPDMYTGTGWLLIVFFVLILPANINAAIHNVDYQNPDATGKGLGYLWFRVPLQLFFIGWIYWSAIMQ